MRQSKGYNENNGNLSGVGLLSSYFSSQPPFHTHSLVWFIVPPPHEELELKRDKDEKCECVSQTVKCFRNAMCQKETKFLYQPHLYYSDLLHNHMRTKMDTVKES